MKYEFFHNINTGVISVAYHESLQGVTEVYSGVETLSVAGNGADGYQALLSGIVGTGKIPEAVKSELTLLEAPENERIKLLEANGVKKVVSVMIFDQSPNTIEKTFEALTAIMNNQKEVEEEDVTLDLVEEE